MTQISIRRFAVCLAALAMFGVAGGPACSQTNEADFYKGKTVRLIVGYGPGGGYDAYARMIAPYIGKTLGANVIVENQPGAGGVKALNVIAAGVPDGLNIMIVNGLGAAFSQLTDQPGVRFDLGKLAHLGTVSASPWVWLTGPNAAIDTPQKALDSGKQYMWSGSGPIDGLSDGAAFTCAALKLNCRIVLGYPGSNEAAIAVTRGEMDMIYVSDTSANNYVRAGQNKAVANMGRVKSRFFPEVPTIFDAVTLDADQQWIFDLHSTAENLGRILVAPPAIPVERLRVLREAIKSALSDPQLVAEGEKTQRYVDFIDAEATRKATLRVVTDITPEQKKRVQEIVSHAETK